MVSDINNYIKLCPNCNTSNKFKKPKVKKKIIIENGTHYRYIVIYGIHQKIFQKIPGINIF